MLFNSQSHLVRQSVFRLVRRLVRRSLGEGGSPLGEGGCASLSPRPLLLGGADKSVFVCANRPLCTGKGEVSPQSGDNAVSRNVYRRLSLTPPPCCSTHHCVQRPVSCSSVFVVPHTRFRPFFMQIVLNYRDPTKPLSISLTPCLPTTSFSNYTTADWLRLVIPHVCRWHSQPVAQSYVRALLVKTCRRGPRSLRADIQKAQRLQGLGPRPSSSPASGPYGGSSAQRVRLEASLFCHSALYEKPEGSTLRGIDHPLQRSIRC
jgi:hypothetical protein